MRSSRSLPENARGPEAVALPAIVAASLVATLAFWAYTRTLLPGVDLGDTGGFQAAVLWPEASARQTYPLYYALARPFVATVSATNPARGLNLFSAVWAAAAVGLLTLLTSLVVRSPVAGAAAGLLLAFSYTFWTQAVIAEVYSLHLALVGACLLTLHAFARKPDTRRLVVFLAIYALSFGNHLSMILLLGPFAAFLLLTHPTPRELFRPGIVALAAGIAAAGALQYTPNVIAVWTSVHAPDAWTERVAAVWFDVTMADWRGAMVLGVGPERARDQLAMWWWDARQQFGIAGLLLAGVGLWRLWTISRSWTVLVALAYAVSTLFALTYNVGDPHVFLLPGHYFTAFAAAAAVAALMPAHVTFVHAADRHLRALRPAAGGALALAALLYAGWRGWDTWPAADRTMDRRGEQLVARVTHGLDGRAHLLVSQLDWQSDNALLYAMRYERRQVAWVRLADVLPDFPALVRENHTLGRDVVLTADAAANVVAAYGPLYLPVEDETLPVPSLARTAAAVPAGAPYVLGILAPPWNQSLDQDALDATLRTLTGRAAPVRHGAAYEVIAGRAGEAPAFHRSSDRPFRQPFALLGDDFMVRMDGWLSSDMFRRGGFGHVLRGREHVLILERGVSLVWFGPDGSPATAYADGLYAPQPRFRIPAGATHLAGRRR